MVLVSLEAALFLSHAFLFKTVELSVPPRSLLSPAPASHAISGSYEVVGDEVIKNGGVPWVTVLAKVPDIGASLFGWDAGERLWWPAFAW